MKRKKEFRIASIDAIDNEENKMTVGGYAAVFNQRALIWESDYSGWKYYEEIDTGAFNGCDLSDVVFKYNHNDSALILGRTRNKTLNLMVDATGLNVKGDIAETNSGKDIYTLIKRRDLDKMSFAFYVKDDQITNDTDLKVSIRKILAFDTICDVSVVDFPAYDGTSIEGRSAEFFQDLEKKYKEQELRKRLYLESLL